MAHRYLVIAHVNGMYVNVENVNVVHVNVVHKQDVRNNKLSFFCLLIFEEDQVLYNSQNIKKIQKINEKE